MIMRGKAGLVVVAGLALVLVLGVAGPARSWFTKGGVTGIGARPLGMGGAFVAVADETSAVFWNPGGLGQLTRAELAGGGSAIFNGKILYLFFSGAWPVLDDSIVSLSWERRDNLESPGKEKEDVYYMTFASTMNEERTFFAGASLKYYLVTSTFPDVGAGGVGIDWGFLYRLPLPRYGKEVRLGACIQDMNTQLKEGAAEGSTANVEQIPVLIRAGLAYQFERWITMAFDLENSKDPSVAMDATTRLRSGVEGWFFDGTLGARLGYLAFATVPGRYTAGMSYRAKDWEVDYAYLGHAGNLGDSHRASFAFRFGKIVVGGLKPATPLGLKSTPKDGEVELVWTPSPEPTVGAYNIYISTAPGGDYKKVNTVGLSSARVIGLENGRIYYFVVSAITNTQPPLESERSPEVPGAPVAPEMTPPELQQQLQEGEITVTWRVTPGDISGYNLYVSTMAGAGHVRYNNTPVTSTQVRMIQVQGQPVVAGERYYIFVRSLSRTQPPVEGPPSPELTYIAVPRQ